MARDQWRHVPQGDAYWRMMTEPTEVMVRGVRFVESVDHDCGNTNEFGEFIEDGYCEECGYEEVLGHNNQIQGVLTPVIVTTMPSFPGLFEDRLEPAWQPFDTENAWCGPFVVLQPISEELSRSTVGWADLDKQPLYGSSVHHDNLIDGSAGIVHPWNVVLAEDLPYYIHDVIASDKVRLTSLLQSFVPDGEKLYRATELNDELEADGLFRQYFHAPQKADWITMLEGVDDECSSSALPWLRPRPWASWLSESHAS